MFSTQQDLKTGKSESSYQRIKNRTKSLVDVQNWSNCRLRIYNVAYPTKRTVHHFIATFQTVNAFRIVLKEKQERTGLAWISNTVSRQNSDSHKMKQGAIEYRHKSNNSLFERCAMRGKKLVDVDKKLLSQQFLLLNPGQIQRSHIRPNHKYCNNEKHCFQVANINLRNTIRSNLHPTHSLNRDISYTFHFILQNIQQLFMLGELYLLPD